MPEFFYIYPSYLTRGPRGEGRRVPEAIAGQDAPLESIVRAARSLGFTVEEESGKQYPRRFQAEPGRVKVLKKAGMTKARALREIANVLRTAPATGERSR